MDTFCCGNKKNNELPKWTTERNWVPAETCLMHVVDRCTNSPLQKFPYLNTRVKINKMQAPNIKNNTDFTWLAAPRKKTSSSLRLNVSSAFPIGGRLSSWILGWIHIYLPTVINFQLFFCHCFVEICGLYNQSLIIPSFSPNFCIRVHLLSHMTTVKQP